MDSGTTPAADPNVPMELRIVLDGLDPPSGRGTLDGHDPWSFVGWIELLQTLERLTVTNS